MPKFTGKSTAGKEEGKVGKFPPFPTHHSPTKWANQIIINLLGTGKRPSRPGLCVVKGQCNHQKQLLAIKRRRIFAPVSPSSPSTFLQILPLVVHIFLSHNRLLRLLVSIPFIHSHSYSSPLAPCPPHIRHCI